LEQVWQQTGEKPAELVGHELPEAIAHVWGYCIALDRTRVRGMGTFPISYMEIGAWSSLMGVQVTPFEVECIRAIDELFLAHTQG
jgi:hypothetical protein